MGMFDTFNIQDRGRQLAVQSKHFACLLDEYRIGDFVSFDHGTPTGITAWIEDHKHDWRDPTCPVEWVVILLVDGCFLDAYVADSETDGWQAATVMVKLWQAPEHQAEALKRHVREHCEAPLPARLGTPDLIAARLHAMGSRQDRRREHYPAAAPHIPARLRRRNMGLGRRTPDAGHGGVQQACTEEVCVSRSIGRDRKVNR